MSSGASRFLRLLSITVVLLLAAALVNVLVLNKPGKAAVKQKVTFLVVDEQGARVADFDAMRHTADNSEGIPWRSYKEGEFKQEFPEALAFEILLRADGYASSKTRFTGEQRENLLQRPATIVLQRGREVTVQFQPPPGTNWPEDASPTFYFDDLRENVRGVWSPQNRSKYGSRLPDFDMLRVHTDKSGRFTFRLADNTRPFYVGLNCPGFLRNFETGPFTLADFNDGVLKVELPRPASIKLNFDASAASQDSQPRGTFRMQIHAVRPGVRDRHEEVATESSDLEKSDLRLDDLAPGDYNATVQSVPKVDVTGKAPLAIDPNRFWISKSLTLAQGDARTLDWKFTPFDSNATRGDATASIRVMTTDGKPAVGREVKIDFWGGHNGAVLVHKGKLPASGEIVLQNIRAARADAPGSGTYEIEADGKRLGTFEVVEGTKRQHIEFHLVPEVGDIAPELTIQNIVSGKPTKLRDLLGKVVVLEFWSTGCGPCQLSMKHLNELAHQEASNWQDRVVLAGISIDESAKTVIRHVQQRGWDKLQHYWSGETDENKWESPAAKAFCLSGTPTTILIDTEGRIVWRGVADDSQGESLKSRIEYLLSRG